jgi:hypothetical protein
MPKLIKTDVWIEKVGDEMNVYDSYGDLKYILTQKELNTKVIKENWHLIPLALAKAVDEFVAGGWELTRPSHCRTRENV